MGTGNKVGRPKNPVKMKLDLSMTADEAKQQLAIANAKQSMFKAQLGELKVSEARKETIDTKIVIAIIQEVLSKLKTSLYGITNNVPAQIIGKSHAEVTTVLYQFIDNAFTKYANDFDDKLDSLKIQEEEEVDE